VLHWIPLSVAGRLAMMARPEGGDALAPSVDGLATGGVTSLVSLLSSEEVEALQLTQEAARCADQGLAFHRLPIGDFGVPSDEDSFWTLAETLSTDLRAGATVVIHCRAGIGRSSLLAAAVLIAGGRAAAEVFPAIAEARGVRVPETEAQRDWLLTSASRRGASSR